MVSTGYFRSFGAKLGTCVLKCDAVLLLVMEQKPPNLSVHDSIAWEIAFRTSTPTYDLFSLIVIQTGPFEYIPTLLYIDIFFKTSPLMQSSNATPPTVPLLLAARIHCLVHQNGQQPRGRVPVVGCPQPLRRRYQRRW